MTKEIMAPKSSLVNQWFEGRGYLEKDGWLTGSCLTEKHSFLEAPWKSILFPTIVFHFHNPGKGLCEACNSHAIPNHMAYRPSELTWGEIWKNSELWTREFLEWYRQSLMNCSWVLGRPGCWQECAQRRLGLWRFRKGSIRNLARDHLCCIRSKDLTASVSVLKL